MGYETALERIQGWVSEALGGRDGTPGNRRSRIKVGGGTTTILLTVLPDDGTPGPRFTVCHMDTAEEFAFNDRPAALAQLERWARG